MLHPKNNNKRFIRLKFAFHFIFKLLQIHVLLSTFPKNKYCRNAMSLNFDSFIHINWYIFRYLTKRGCKCFILPKLLKTTLCLCIYFVFTKKTPIIVSLFKIDILNFTMHIFTILACPFKNTSVDHIN